MSFNRRLTVWVLCMLTAATTPTFAQSKPAQAKPTQTKPTQTKPAEPKPAQTKPTPSKSAADKPEATTTAAIRLRRLASDQNILFIGSDGWGAPPAGTTNKTERLLSERSVQAFAQQLFTEIKKTIETRTRQDKFASLALATVPTLICAALNHPSALSIEDFTVSNPPEIKLAFVVDAESDADQVRDALDKLMAATPKEGPGSFVQETTDGVTFHYPNNPRANDKLLPRIGMFKSYLIVTIGSEMAAQTLKKIQGPDQSPPWLNTTLSDLSVKRPKLAWLLNADAVKAKVEPLIHDPNARAFLEATGLFDLKQISSVVGLDDVDVVSKLRIETSRAPRGLLNLISHEPLTVEDLKSIPANPVQAHLIRLDLAHLTEQLLTIAEQTGPSARQNFEFASQQGEQQLGFSLIEDLLPAFGDLWCCYVSNSEGGLIPGVVVTAALQDAAKLTKVQDALVGRIQAGLQRAGPRSPFNLHEFTANDATGYRVQFTQLPLPIAPSWVITDKEFVFGISPQLVTAHLSAHDQKTSLADQEDLQTLLKRNPSPVLLSYSDPRPQVQGFYTIFNMFSPVVAGQLMQQGINFNFPPLPPYSVLEPHLLPGVTTLTPLPDGWSLESHGVVPSIGTAAPLVIAVASALSFTAIQPARQAAQQTQSKNNLKQIGLAMHNYHDGHNHFPSRVTRDQAGKPGLSWRVQLLPLMDEQALYDEFHLDEPWDSDHNKTLIDRMPRVYAAPEAPELAKTGLTRYLVMDGDGCLFDGDEGPGLRQITDGSSNTIMVVEARDDRAVIWTKPDDLKLDVEDPMDGLQGARGGNGFLTLFSDGACRFISDGIDPTVLNALFTRAGGEILGNF